MLPYCLRNQLHVLPTDNATTNTFFGKNEYYNKDPFPFPAELLKVWNQKWSFDSKD